MSGTSRASLGLIAFAVTALGVSAPASANDSPASANDSIEARDPIEVGVRSDGVIDAGSLASELAVRLSGARVRVTPRSSATGSGIYLVTVTSSPAAPSGGPRLRLLVHDPDRKTILAHRARVAAPTQTVRELAVLIEGAIRLHRREIDELLRRLASDVPRLALSLHLGGRALLDRPRLTPIACVALRLRFWQRLVLSLGVEGSLPWEAEREQIGHRVQIFTLRSSVAYPIAFSQVVAFIGVGLDLSLILGRFNLPNGKITESHEVSATPLLSGEVEWPRDARLRLVVAGALGYSFIYPEFQWAGARVTAIGPWSGRASVGGRWVF